MFTDSHSVLCVCRINNVCTLVVSVVVVVVLVVFVVRSCRRVSIILFGVVADARLDQTTVINYLTVRICVNIKYYLFN